MNVVASTPDLVALDRFVRELPANRLPRRLQVQLQVAMWCCTALITGGFLLSSRDAGSWVLLVGACLSFVLPQWLQRRFRTHSETTIFDARLTVTSDGLTVEGPERTTTLRFGGILGATDDGSRIMVCTGRCSGSVVPKRCFEDPNDYDAFLRTLTDGIARTRSTAPA